MSPTFFGFLNPLEGELGAQHIFEKLLIKKKKTYLFIVK